MTPKTPSIWPVFRNLPYLAVFSAIWLFFLWGSPGLLYFVAFVAVLGGLELAFVVLELGDPVALRTGVRSVAFVYLSGVIREEALDDIARVTRLSGGLSSLARHYRDFFKVEFRPPKKREYIPAFRLEKEGLGLLLDIAERHRCDVPRE